MKTLLALALAASTGVPFSVKSSPVTLMTGQSLALTCRVPRQPDNRLVRYGVLSQEMVLDSGERELAGVDSPTIFQPRPFRVDCAAVAVFCEVYRNDGTHKRIVQPIQVNGCN